MKRQITPYRRAVPGAAMSSKGEAEASRKERRDFTLIVMVLVALAIGCGILAAQFNRGRKDISANGESTRSSVSALLSSPRPLADFSLTNCAGQPVSRADLRGRFLVVNLVFAGCSLSCFSVNERMAEIQKLVSDNSDVRLLSLTVDPRRDTPEVLARFGARFHADTNRWLFLTGEKCELYRLIETSFIPSPPNPAQLVPGGFVNTDRIMVVDRAGNVCASFNGMKRDVAQEVFATIEWLRKTNANVRVFISGDQDARHGDIIRVLDLVRSTGIEKVAFEIRPASGGSTPAP